MLLYYIIVGIYLFAVIVQYHIHSLIIGYNAL